MQGCFCFDDLHTKVRIPLRSGRAIPLQLHIAVTIHEVDLSAQKEDDNPVNGVVIEPERACDKGIPFLAFGQLVELPPPEQRGILAIDMQEQEMFWRPPNSDFVAMAIRNSLNTWDGQQLAELHDDLARTGIASYLAQIARAAGIKQFWRSSGEPVEYEPYLVL